MQIVSVFIAMIYLWFTRTTTQCEILWETREKFHKYNSTCDISLRRGDPLDRTENLHAQSWNWPFFSISKQLRTPNFCLKVSQPWRRYAKRIVKRNQSWGEKTHSTFAITTRLLDQSCQLVSCSSPAFLLPRLRSLRFFLFPEIIVSVEWMPIDTIDDMRG